MDYSSQSEMPDPAKREVTELLEAWQHGDAGARERLLPVVYDELRRVARARLRRERPDHTLQATALVHEAVPAADWSRRSDAAQPRTAVRDRRSVDARDSGRSRAPRTRRSSEAARQRKVSLDDAVAAPQVAIVDVLALDEALGELSARDARLCQAGPSRNSLRV